MPRSRRNNRYCRTIATISEIAINRASNISDLRAAFAHNRYHKINLEAYARHRTVESASTEVNELHKDVCLDHFLAKMIPLQSKAR